MSSKIKTAALFAMGFGFSGSLARAEGNYHGYETPRYTTEAALDEAELRHYDPYIVAQVAVRGDRSTALTDGFRILASYIFGGNSGAQKVAMTVPVTQETNDPIAGADGVWTVTFSMPRDFTLSTLPAPANAAVRFAERPAERMLVIEFSGRATDSAIEEQITALRAIADRHGIQLAGGPVIQFYDDPMTLPWNRRNEVGFRVVVD